jgi:hypothetical protein
VGVFKSVAIRMKFSGFTLEILGPENKAVVRFSIKIVKISSISDLPKFPTFSE